MRNFKKQSSWLLSYLLAFALVFFVFPLFKIHAQVCNEFNSGSSQSALNIQLDKDKFIELTYKDIARTKKDDFTLSFSNAVKQTLRNASKNSGQILSIIIKYDKSESSRPLMVPLIRFFVSGSLGASSVQAESSNVSDCKEVHNFNISAQEVRELFQNNRLDFDLLINVLNQGPANRTGQKFRITICLNCAQSPETASTPGSSSGKPPDLPADAPPENSTTWIIVDGKGAGVQIHSEPDLEGLIESDANPTTMASGEVVEPDEVNCSGPLKHYHGSLLGEDDPQPTMCGWGHAIRFDAASENLQRLSAVLNLENRANEKIIGEPQNLEGALSDINGAITEVKEIIKNLKTDKTIDKKRLHNIVRKLKKVSTLDETIAVFLKAAQKAEDPKKKEKTIKNALGLINSAFETKFSVFTDFVKKELEDSE